MKLTALNNANPEGPKATEFLIQSCEAFAAEVSHFVTDQLNSLITEGQNIEASKKAKKRQDKAESTRHVDASKHLLNQLEAMKDETESLVQVAGAIRVRCLLTAFDPLVFRHPPPTYGQCAFLICFKDFSYIRPSQNWLSSGAMCQENEPRKIYGLLQVHTAVIYTTKG